MGVPFPARKPSSNVPLMGVNEYGGIDNNKQKAKTIPGMGYGPRTGNPKGVDEHGGTEGEKSDKG